jgi:hypothetical protein
MKKLITVIFQVLYFLIACAGSTNKTDAGQTTSEINQANSTPDFTESADTLTGRDRPWSKGREKIWERNFEEEYAVFFQKNLVPENIKDLIRASLLKYFKGSIAAATNKTNNGRAADTIYRITEKEQRDRNFEMEMKEALGEKLFKELVFYRDTIPQRKFVVEVAEHMQEANCSLNVGEIDGLVRLLKTSYITPIPAEVRSRSPYLAEMNARDFSKKGDVVMRDAAKILSPQQMKVFIQIWNGIASDPSGQAASMPQRTLAKADLDEIDSMMRYTVKKRFGQDFKAFFQKHPMPAEKQNSIQIAYVNYFVNREDFTSKEMTGKTINNRLRELEKELKGTIDTKTITALKIYIEALVPRRLANGVADRMKAANYELDSDKIEKLVHIFHNNRINYVSTRFLRQRQEPKPEWFLSQERATLRAIDAILTKEQQSVFRQYWTQLTSYGNNLQEAGDR